MPIYDQGYQRWKGELQRYPVRWWPILRRGFLQVIKQRKFLFLLVLAWLQPFVQGVRLFLGSRVSSAVPQVRDLGLFRDGMEFYYDVFQNQSFMILLFVVMIGSDLVARDRRFNALQIYFSKPLTPNDYILGKLGIVGSYVLLITFVPILLLWLFALSLQLRSDYFASVWTLPFVAAAYSLLIILVAGMLVLALSSVGRRTIIISVSWIILFGYGALDLVVAILQGLSGDEWWALIRPAGNLDQVGAWWFGADLPHQVSPLASLLLLLAVVAVSYAVMRRRIKPVEVVL